MNGDTTTNTSVALTADSATATASPINKKSKTKSIFDDHSSNIFSSDLFTKIDVHSYQQSKPYPHQQITNVFKAQFLLDLKEEIKFNSKVNFKESDLFRVYQSIDLANLNNLSSSPPDGPEEEEATKCKLTNSLLLRDILYSQEWRSYMEQCTGLTPGTLINKIDCACNCHTPGCHLLCHDDVIGTRKISYIIYLTEIDWNTEKEGGTLELYDQQYDEDDEENDDDESKSKSNKSRLPVPVSRIKPIFNSMAFFEVLPGRSYHAVQEVIGDRPRLSLQGWYHSNEIPKGIENATLQQLKTMNNTKLKLKKKVDDVDVDVDVEDDPTTSSSSSAAAAATTTDNENSDAIADTTTDTDTTTNTKFTENDRLYLKEYIKNEYLTNKSMNDIRIKFENNSSVQFCNFLLEKYVPTIQSCWKEESEVSDENEKKLSATVVDEATNYDDPTIDDDITNKHYYMQGVTSEWKLRGPAHKQRYLRYEEDNNNNNSSDNDTNVNNNNDNDDGNDNAASTGSIMNTVKKQVFESEPFKRYLKAVTSLDYSTGIVGNEIRRFRPGLDYTVAHYGLLSNMDEVGVLDATMCFVDDQTEDKKGYWECGDVGGFECYIEADIDDDDDEDDENDAAAAADATMNGASSATAAMNGSQQAADDEYNEDDDTELLSVSASNNTLSLVYRDPGTMRFVKYVGSSAPSSRYDICMEYELPPDNDNDNDYDVIEEEEGEADDDMNEEDEEEVMMKESK